MLLGNPFEETNLKGAPLILDGAMGSLLQENGFIPDSRLWMSKLNITNPDFIKSIHEEYIAAGADIITTNTFRSNPAAFNGTGYKFESKYVTEGVKIAKEAARNSTILIAGSNPPAEDCYQKVRKLNYNKLEINHINHIELLIDNVVDFILNETQSYFDEIKIICKYCSQNDIPYVISLFFDEDLKIFSGEDVKYIVDYITDHNTLAIGFNCIAPKLFQKMLRHYTPKYIWGFYLNCGEGNPQDEIIKCGIIPKEYSDFVSNKMRYKPSFVGACCGSNPNHIRELKKLYAQN